MPCQQKNGCSSSKCDVIAEHLFACLIGNHSLLQCASQQEKPVGDKDVYCSIASKVISSSKYCKNCHCCIREVACIKMRCFRVRHLLIKLKVQRLTIYGIK